MVDSRVIAWAIGIPPGTGPWGTIRTVDCGLRWSIPGLSEGDFSIPVLLLEQISVRCTALVSSLLGRLSEDSEATKGLRGGMSIVADAEEESSGPSEGASCVGAL